MTSSGASHAHGGDHGDHGHGHPPGAIHATLPDYLKGLVLSAVLTAIPFWLVMAKVFSASSATAVALLALAAAQVLVHMVYFLHMNTKSEGGWTVLALIFTIVLIFITLIGSLWVMFHLNANMMPMSTQHIHSTP